MRYCNIGNTHMQLADESGAVETVLTQDFLSGKIAVPSPAAVASVVPEADCLFSPEHTFFLTARTARGVDFSQVDASTLGPDRVANALALADGGKLPGICVDCGTAITLEAVDARGVFRGGAILPGRMLLRQALQKGTAKLPMVELSSELPNFFGTNTCSAIKVGVDLGAAGSVRAILRMFLALPGMEHAAVLAAGGDADFFLKALPELKSGGNDFTLRGLRAAVRHAAWKETRE